MLIILSLSLVRATVPHAGHSAASYPQQKTCKHSSSQQSPSTDRQKKHGDDANKKKKKNKERRSSSDAKKAAIVPERESPTASFANVPQGEGWHLCHDEHGNAYVYNEHTRACIAFDIQHKSRGDCLNLARFCLYSAIAPASDHPMSSTRSDEDHSLGLNGSMSILGSAPAVNMWLVFLERSAGFH